MHHCEIQLIIIICKINETCGGVMVSVRDRVSRETRKNENTAKVDRKGSNAGKGTRKDLSRTRHLKYAPPAVRAAFSFKGFVTEINEVRGLGSAGRRQPVQA